MDPTLTNLIILSVILELAIITATVCVLVGVEIVKFIFNLFKKIRALL